MTSAFQHQSVLLNESIDGLHIKPNGTYIDATFGRGGHSQYILSKLDENGRLIGLDRDLAAITAADSMTQDNRFSIHHVAFADLLDVTDSLNLTGKIDGILMDIGVSSPQLDDASRGFSFQKDGPLDMRMDTSTGVSVAEWLMYASLDDITQVLKEFGEEKFGKRIAHAILETRVHTPITTTAQLAKIIDQAVPVKDKFKHPATRSFQGLRIFINGELDQLAKGLTSAITALRSGGRLAVISFHSLEDRQVKRFIRHNSQGLKVPSRLPISQQEIDAKKILKTIGKAIKPSAEEVSFNVRSRSSVLRVAEKL